METGGGGGERDTLHLSSSGLIGVAKPIQHLEWSSHHTNLLKQTSSPPPSPPSHPPTHHPPSYPANQAQPVGAGGVGAESFIMVDYSSGNDSLRL